MMRYFMGEYFIEGDETITLAQQGGFDYGMESDWCGGVELKSVRATQEDRMFAHKLTEEEVKTYTALEEEQKISLLKATTVELNQQLDKEYAVAKEAGATGMVAILEPNPTTKECGIVVVNLGDSQLLVVNPQAKTIERQNILHNPLEPSERRRLLERGIKLEEGQFRLGSGLAVSRSFGDFSSHPHGLTDEPEITYQKYPMAEGEELIFIAACDGLADEKKYRPERVLEGLLAYSQVSEDKGKNLRKLAHYLAENASIHTRDNVSLEIVRVTSATEATPMILGIFDGHSADGEAGAKVAEFLRVKWLQVFTKRLLNRDFSLPEEIDGTPPTQSLPSGSSSSEKLRESGDSAMGLAEKKFKAEVDDEEDKIVWAHAATIWKLIDETDRRGKEKLVKDERSKENRANSTAQGRINRNEESLFFSDRKSGISDTSGNESSSESDADIYDSSESQSASDYSSASEIEVTSSSESNSEAGSDWNASTSSESAHEMQEGVVHSRPVQKRQHENADRKGGSSRTLIRSKTSFILHNYSRQPSPPAPETQNKKPRHSSPKR